MESLRPWLIAYSLCLILAKWRYYATESLKIKEMWIENITCDLHILWFLCEVCKPWSFSVIYLLIACIGVKREVCLHFNFCMLVFPQAGKQTKWSDILGFMCTKKVIIILVGLPLSLCSQLTTWKTNKFARAPGTCSPLSALHLAAQDCAILRGPSLWLLHQSLLLLPFLFFLLASYFSPLRISSLL